VLSVCLTPDGQWVMSGSKDRGVQFWDPATGNAQMMLQGHKNSGKFFPAPSLGSLPSRRVGSIDDVCFHQLFL
jgi:glucose repression regulatory protein TUP1